MRRVIMPLVLACLMASAFVGISPAATVTVSMVEYSFNPQSITVNSGDTVTWVNQGTMPHTSTSGSSCTGNGLWDSGIIAPGGSYSLTFTSPGTYNYFCSIHCALGMTGVVTVASSSSQSLTFTQASSYLGDSNNNHALGAYYSDYGLYLASIGGNPATYYYYGINYTTQAYTDAQNAYVSAAGAYASTGSTTGYYAMLYSYYNTLYEYYNASYKYYASSQSGYIPYFVYYTYLAGTANAYAAYYSGLANTGGTK